VAEARVGRQFRAAGAEFRHIFSVAQRPLAKQAAGRRFSYSEIVAPDKPITLLVLARPDDPHLAMLERLPGDTRILAGDSPEAFEAAAGEADAIFAWSGNAELLDRVLRMAPRVRWVQASSAGVDGLLGPALVESQAELTNARGAFSGALGEFALAAILFFAKDLRRMMRSQAQGMWDQFDGQLVHGKALGIVGYGDIGHAVAQRAHPLGMRILAARRRPERSANDPLIERAFPSEARRELMAASDYVVVAAPLTPETRGSVGEAEIGAMKPEAVLINIGRGPVVDERALVRALEEKRIRGAALDVFEREPLEAGHPFYRLENVLLSAHCADHTVGWLARSMEVFLANFERFRQGLPLRNVVDKRCGY
jgi:phosphoglycerate dehydrogenase-like enzyme